MNPNVETLRESRADVVRQAQVLIDRAEAERRDMTQAEARSFDRLMASAEDLAGEISRLETANPELRPSLKQRDVAPPGGPNGAYEKPRTGGLPLGCEDRSYTRSAVARGQLRQELTYRPDAGPDDPQFFRDLLLKKANHDARAIERLGRNEREALDTYGLDGPQEWRDMSNASTAGEDFVPPLYLGNAAVTPSIARRPFADSLPKMPLPPHGTDISIPHLSSGVAVAARSDAGAVQETDGVTASITHDVNEIAGQVDIGRIAVMRSQPGLDRVIMDTLIRRHDAYLDTQLLSGTGTAPQHRGVRAVSGVNTTSYTAATPTGAGLLPKIYEAIEEVATARAGEVYPSAIVLHSRRANWLASTLSSTFPLFAQGQLMQAAGTQDGGFLSSFAGLKVIVDNNIGTTYGAGTNEDEIYVVALEDLFLLESPLFAKVWDSVGSANGIVRFQIFSHSAFLSKRYPASISVISGTGLAAPTWT